MPDRPDRYLERSFPIVQINPLSARERNAFKPVYTMHKWFARRSASIFRAILLGAALPYDGTDLMAEFYQGHVDDPRLRGPGGGPLRVLDPFMGGGTTVVEALRLGMEVIGVDYNPVAWFIVRGETANPDPARLAAAFARLADKVRDELLALYQTACPLTGEAADIIYAFWVKQGVCLSPTCGQATDLFKSYEVARKRGDATLRCFPNVCCSGCELIFDWELDRCTVTAGGPQVDGLSSNGKGKPVAPRAFGRREEGVCCPQCGVLNTPLRLDTPQSRKVPLHVLYDPSTGDLFEVRGDIPPEVTAPSGHRFRPDAAPVIGAGKFQCAHCGRKQAIVEAADTLGRPLPFRCYGFYAYTRHSEEPARQVAAERLGLPTNNHKWFARATAADLARIEQAARDLEHLRADLPMPEQEISDGYNTNRLYIHGYRRWSQLYGPRHLLGLGKLLRAIMEEPDGDCQDALLGAFQSHLDSVSNLIRYDISTNKISGVTSAHDFRNPTTIAENNIWGIGENIGRGPFSACFEKYRDGIAYINAPDLTAPEGYVAAADAAPERWRRALHRRSSTDLSFLAAESVDLCITDPPYAGSVQYAEMSDWSYVWLHHALKDRYPEEFGSEITLKSEEIIEDGRYKDQAFFFENLTLVWREVYRVLRAEGLLVFTFHHPEGDRWSGLLRSIFEAGFYLVAAYPARSEAANSIVIQATEGITYDIIHVCRKRTAAPEPIPWSTLRREVQREAREQLREIEGRRDVLPGPDVWMILLGKSLMRFSQHYGQVLDQDGAPMDLAEAMDRLSALVREIRGEAPALPAALGEADALTQVVLQHVLGRPGWTRDGLHIELRGYAITADALEEAGLIRAVAGDRNRLEPVPALERFAQRRKHLQRLHAPLIDRVHLLLGTLHAGEPPEPLRTDLKGHLHMIHEAVRYLGKQDSSLRELCELSGRLLTKWLPEDKEPVKAEQLRLFKA